MTSKMKCPEPGCQNFCYVGSQRCIECSVRLRRREPLKLQVETPPEVVIEQRIQESRSEAELSRTKKLLDAALKQIEHLQSERAVFLQLEQGLNSSVTIEPKEPSHTSEAVPVLVASDWHSEELVTLAQSNGLNEFNLEIAEKRIRRFFQSGLNLIKNHLNPGVAIHQVVLALLGDFITNDIHEELVENVALGPTAALIFVQNLIVAGIQFLLDNSPYKYTVVCRVGNHSRTTKKTHFSQENDHSLEHLMYVFLKAHFRNESRIEFVIQEGYHIFVDVFDKTLRFHHGHAINYQGGIGGITIPVIKAIAAWDKAVPADLDVFGHFHQTLSNNKFKANGSLIGYGAYGVRVKGEYEPPKQTLFLVDKKSGITADWPIYV